MSIPYTVYTFNKLRDIKALEEACKIHNKSFTQDSVDTHSFLRFILDDPNARDELIFLVTDSKGKIEGFLVGVELSKEPNEAIDRFKDTIWIKDFAVDPDLEKELWVEIGLNLIKAFEEKAKALNKKRIVLYAYAPFYFMPGLNIVYEDYLELFEKLGFTKVEEDVSYEVDLSQFYIPRRVLRIKEKLVNTEGIVFRKGSEDEADFVSKWVGEAFENPFWRLETLYAFKNRPPTLLLAERGRSLLGFAVYNRVGRNEFGPIGVEQRARRLGIGTVLLFEALSELKLMGFRYAVIPWTSHLFFYTQVPGIAKIKHYLILNKTL